MTTITPAQTDYINSLLRSRNVPEALIAEAKRVSTKVDASRVITALKLTPYKPRSAAVKRTPEHQAYVDALAAVEVSKYAVPTAYLRLALPEMNLKGDLLFLEVRNYSGRRQFFRLSGAPGRFNRYRIEREAAIGLLKFIAGRHVEFAKLFSEHYGVCGRCAAELTDQESRETGFGPTCRKVFGI